MEYAEFLEKKRVTVDSVGFDIQESELNPMLFDWQRAIVRWALHRGRAALFEDCGLGKTPQQLEWARHVAIHTGGNVLILAPLAVAAQTKREGEKFGINVTLCKCGSDVKDGINIANYERLHHFTPDMFTGIVLDESSILKSFDGTTRKQIQDFAKSIKYRLACTATPAPNDLIELTNHAEFLDVMSGKEIIALFFKQDGNTTHQWRLKGHAKDAFWTWMAQWSIAIRRPSDIGYDDGKFKLPELNMHHITVEGKASEGFLFAIEAQTLQDRRNARRASMNDRVAVTAGLANKSTDKWLIWCDLNAESDALTKAITGAVEVKGADSSEWKESVAMWFQGKKCICNMKEFRSKLSSCKQTNKENTSESTTQSTEKSDAKRQTNTKKTTEKKGTSICGSGLPKTGITSENIEGQQLTNETQTGEPITHKANNLESNAEHLLSDGNCKTLISDSRNDLNRTGSRQSNTETCLRNRMAVAPFVAQSNRLISHEDRKAESADYILTTTTPQEKSEVYYARPAILDSESLETVPTNSIKHTCICGHKSGVRRLVTKSSIFGFGLNFQACNKVAFVGLSDSYEAFYQAIRRCWRFGQTKPVDCYVIAADTEGAVVSNIERKEKQASQMFDEIVKKMSVHELNRQQRRDEMTYKVDNASGEGWQLMLGDSCERIKEIPDGSIGLSVFSPPFPGMYAYTNSSRDIGNVKDFSQLIAHFAFLMEDMKRITMPGRMCCIHLTQEPVFKGRDGYVGLRDFRGDVIRAMEDAGWYYYSEVTIDKNPMLKASRTKEATLLFKTLSKDSAGSRPALADYLLVFKAPGVNEKPITAGTHEKYNPKAGWISGDEWCEWAAPVWYRAMPKEKGEHYPFQGNYPSRHQETDGISEMDVLRNFTEGKSESDEKHLCPLQLGVIERCIKLWSAPGDTVFSPFAGIGSEGYQAIKFNRKFIGCELKESYWKVACDNLKRAVEANNEQQLI